MLQSFGLSAFNFVLFLRAPFPKSKNIDFFCFSMFLFFCFPLILFLLKLPNAFVTYCILFLKRTKLIAELFLIAWFY